MDRRLVCQEAQHAKKGCSSRSGRLERGRTFGRHLFIVVYNVSHSSLLVMHLFLLHWRSRKAMTHGIHLFIPFNISRTLLPDDRPHLFSDQSCNRSLSNCLLILQLVPSLSARKARRPIPYRRRLVYSDSNLGSPDRHIRITSVSDWSSSTCRQSTLRDGDLLSYIVNQGQLLPATCDYTAMLPITPYHTIDMTSVDVLTPHVESSPDLTLPHRSAQTMPPSAPRTISMQRSWSRQFSEARGLVAQCAHTGLGERTTLSTMDLDT